MKKYYFAYGSNLWLKQMNERCPENEKIGLAVLRGYRWMINTRGFANIALSKKDEVWGIVYTISKSDEITLDKFEGVSKGSYKKIKLDTFMDSNKLQCLVYIDPIVAEGKSKKEYNERINRGLEDSKLSKEYVEKYIRKFISS